MKPGKSPAGRPGRRPRSKLTRSLPGIGPGLARPRRGAIDEVSVLIEALHQAGQRLEHLTAGEVDTVADRHGQTFLLRTAQDQVRHIEADKQAAILNALPASIALLDTQGVIVSVNEAWRQFAGPRVLQSPGSATGLNYLDVCDSARGADSPEAHEIANGVRSVLSGAVSAFSIEYSCHSPTAQRWFLLTVTPLALDRPNGVVVMHLDITERKRGEEEIRRFAAAMDALADAVILVDRSGMRIVHVNEAACRYMNKTREQLLALDPWVWLATSRAELERDYDALIASGVPAAPIEILRRRKDGSEPWIELRRHAARSEDRWIIVTIMRDITERKQSQQALLESERRLSDMLANVELLAVMLDREARVTYCNEHFLRLTGWRYDEVIGQSWVEKFIPPEAADLKERLATLLTDQPEARHGESVILTRSGERLLIRWNNSLLRSGAGDVNGTASIGEDITEQRRGEEALRRFSAAMDATADAIYLVDRTSMRFIHVNAAACRMQSHTREELLALGPDRVLSVSRAELERTYDALIASGVDAEPVDLLRARKDGSQVWVEMRRHAQRMGDRWTIITLVRDVTERKLAEAKITRLNRVYAVLSGINTAIVRIRERNELFREVCRIAVSEGGFSLARVLEVDANARVRIASTSESDSQLFQGIVDGYNTDPEHSQSLLAVAMRECQPVISNDVAADPRIPNRDALTKDGNYALALLPIIVEQRIVGSVMLRTHESGTFDEAELRLLREVCSNLSFALEHMDKEKRVQRLTRVYAVLSGINALIVRVSDREELFREACAIAVEAGKFRLACVVVADRQAAQVKAVAWAGDESGFLHLNRPIVGASGQGKPGLGAQAIEKRSPVICNDIAADGSLMRYPEEALARGYRSVAALPLLVDGTAVAALVLYAAETKSFDEEETKLLVELAGDISFALTNIKAAGKLDRLTRVNAMLSGINGAIVRIRDRQALLEEACRIGVETGGFTLAWIGVVDGAAKVLAPVAWAGPGREYADKLRLKVGDAAPDTSSLAAQAIREKRPVVSNDVEHDPRVVLLAEMVRHGLGSVVVLPLVVHGEAQETLTLVAAETDFFDAGEVKLLSEVAGNIAFALEHIEKEEKVQRLTRVYAVLSGINMLIVRAKDRDELFNEACRIAVEAGHFLKAWVGIVGSGSQPLRIVAAHGADPLFFQSIERQLNRKLSAGKGLVVRALETGKPVISNDVASDPEMLLEDGTIAASVRSVVLLPLIVAGEAIGVLTLSADTAGFFDDEEMKLLVELAGDIAFAIDHIEKQERLDYLAYYDPLTGLANRSLFLERVAQYMRSAATGGHKLAVFLIDLERFRNINDSLGRAAGDALLTQVAEWLTRKAGEASLLARVGADQFAVVLPEVKQEGSVARLIQNWMDASLAHPFRLNDAVFRIAAKVGVALFPEDGADADLLLRNAEAALKKAKTNGQRYMFYTQTMTDAVTGKLTMENQLRQALDNEEFVLHYQPKVNLQSGELAGVEALLRWNDPLTGLVPPGRFIPILEETGMIQDVGRWALRKAIEDYLRWRAAGLPAVRIAVNVSPLQLHSRGFIAEIEEAIGIDPLAAAGLELEITESVIMEDVKHNIASLQAIRAMGVTIAIDDFGTGFSSLSYLARLPVDTLKIDRSFVIDLTGGAQGLALVSTIISLAHALKLKVVAEGVETEEQARLLRLLNCDEMQGYLFSKPVSREIFEAKFLALPVAA